MISVSDSESQQTQDRIDIIQQEKFISDTKENVSTQESNFSETVVVKFDNVEPVANLISQKNIESIENTIENEESVTVLEKNNLIENESLHTMLPVVVDKPETSFSNEPASNGYIVEVPLNVSKQSLQFKIKKNKPDDILQTIRQYHNVRLDDAKRTLK